MGLCEVCLLRNIRLTYSLAGGGVRGAWLGAVWLAFSPYFLELWVGQFTFLLGCLLFWSVLALERGRTGTALGWWTASVLWKPASLLWLPLWLALRPPPNLHFSLLTSHFSIPGRFRPGLALCAVLLALNGVYFAFFPADWRVFVDTNLHPLPSWHAGNVGLSGLIYHFTGRESFVPVRLVLTAILVLPALWVTFRRPPNLHFALSNSHFSILAALWTALYFLVYKDVWEHHLTLLLPFLVLALWRAPSRFLVGITVLLALPSPFILYDVPGLGFTSDPQPYFSWSVSLLHHSWRVIPVLLLYGHWLRMGWPAQLRAAGAKPLRRGSDARSPRIVAGSKERSGFGGG